MPFSETWPPTENNLGGPYWERRLSGKGVHALDYTPPLQSRYSRNDRSGGLRGDVVVANRRRKREGGFGVFVACAMAFGVIGCCAMGVANCLIGAGAGGGSGGGESAGRRSVGGGPRKARGRTKWGRRAGAKNDI